jgi:hypothetical protein
VFFTGFLGAIMTVNYISKNRLVPGPNPELAEMIAFETNQRE